MMMNKMREIYGVVNMILFPEDEDPEMLSLELFSSFAKAKERSEEIIKEFIDDYGEDYIEHATKKNPVYKCNRSISRSSRYDPAGI